MGPLSATVKFALQVLQSCISQDNFDLFFDIISFQHVLHFDVGRSEIEWNMKLKMEISHRAKSATKHHSNPYIESTTILSDNAHFSCKVRGMTSYDG